MAPPEIGFPRVQETEMEVASNYNPIKANLSNNPSLKEILDESVAEIVTRKGYPEDLKLRIVTSSLATITIAIGFCAQFYDTKLPENRKILVGCIGFLLQLITFLFENKRILSTHPSPRIRFAWPFRDWSMGVEWAARRWHGKHLVSMAFSQVLAATVYFIWLERNRRWREGKTSTEEQLVREILHIDCFFSTGLVVTSVLPKYSDKYTLIIESTDPQSIAANPSVRFTKSVTKWFTNDGTLVEGLFWKESDEKLHE